MEIQIHNKLSPLTVQKKKDIKRLAQHSFLMFRFFHFILKEKKIEISSVTPTELQKSIKRQNKNSRIINVMSCAYYKLLALIKLPFPFSKQSFCILQSQLLLQTECSKRRVHGIQYISFSRFYPTQTRTCREIPLMEFVFCPLQAKHNVHTPFNGVKENTTFTKAFIHLVSSPADQL